MCVLNSAQGAQRIHRLASGSDIDARKARVRVLIGYNASCAAVSTASVSLFCGGGWFEQKLVNGSLSIDRPD